MGITDRATGEAATGAIDVEFRHELAQQLRVDSVRASATAGSGHPTSSMSAADLMAVLLDGYLKLDYSRPDDPHRDHLIFSKGHASPLYYSILKAVGSIDDEELLTFRKLGSRLEGHPTPRIPPTDVATGSLGQGFPIGVGLALAGKRLDRLPYRVWVLCGDSEMAEGSIWEAFEQAGWAGLDNLTTIVDVNRLGQTRETMLGWDLDTYAARARAFGWHAIEIDGHDLDAIDAAYREALATTGRPTVILARTLKGKGVKAVENKNGFHGKPLPDPEEAIRELGGERNLRVKTASPSQEGDVHRFETSGAEPTQWELGDEVATREAYGHALVALGSRHGDVVAMDGEVSNSTFSELFREAHGDRYFEMFIAEQQMVAAAVGMQVRHWVPFASTFSPPSSPAPMTSSGWRRSPAPTSASSAPTPAYRSARTAHRRWRWKISRCCGRFTAAPCCTPPTQIRYLRWSSRWPTALGSPICGRCAERQRFAPTMERTSESASEAGSLERSRPGNRGRVRRHRR